LDRIATVLGRPSASLISTAGNRRGIHVGTEEGTPHLFVMRIWVDPPATLSRGLIEHIPTGERRYFRDLSEITAFVSSRLSQPSETQEIDPDAA
jgi:hypothetical protein